MDLTILSMSVIYMRIGSVRVLAARRMVRINNSRVAVETRKNELPEALL